MIPVAEATWRALAEGHGAEVVSFDPATLDGLPAPAQRFLAAALPDGTPLRTVVRLDMEGEIKLGGRWLPFSARQILRAGAGFVWAPTVGGRILRFTGADVLGPVGAHVEFRLQGAIPVVRGQGPDVARSAAGRLAAETVAWLPQALTPQAGARWRPIDDRHATVILDAAGHRIEMETAVDADGRLRELGLQRWRDSAKPPGHAPFGGSVDSVLTLDDGVTIAGSGTVGWDWHTDQEPEGRFFRYRITSAAFPEPEPPDPDRGGGAAVVTARGGRSSTGGSGSTVDLYWIPLGAGQRIVQWSGRAYEALAAWRQRRRRRDLYHAALVVGTPDGPMVIEQAPVPDGDGASRGVVASGPVGSRLVGRFRIFRYEVRCWPDGTIPDISFAVDSPISLSDDPNDAVGIVEALHRLPALTWGRDEAGTGDMWNSNSVISWALTEGGLSLEGLRPPPGGRAPGWRAGRTVAGREVATGPASVRAALGPRGQSVPE